jgi:tripeptide aminopeptidase
MVAPAAAATDIAAIALHGAVARARAQLRTTDAETLADMRSIVTIPAPSLEERERADWIGDRFADLGLLDVQEDEAGNVIAWRPGKHTTAPPVILAAHLDTVFPRNTNLTLRETDGRLSAPGIADNARGLAALLAIARVLEDVPVTTRHPLVFVATVGEEGIGDLRGVKHLFRQGSPFRHAVGFIALDGTGLSRIVQRGVGSRRLRVSVSGPGGHSWADRGMANPIHALGEAIARLTRLAPDRDAPAALAVGRIGGGTSVNAIPEKAWIEVDLRAEARGELELLETGARAAIEQVVSGMNAARRPGTAALQLELAVIGDRPSGATPTHAPLVRFAHAATRYVGQRAELVASSTDANVPIALGIPAITLGAGGESGRTHTMDEWYANARGPEGIERALLTALAVAGVE